MVLRPAFGRWLVVSCCSLVSTATWGAGSRAPNTATAPDAADTETETAADPDEPSAEDLAAAKAEVKRARAAAGRGEYEVAVQHFEAALALHPVPQLHYNIAVCHHGRAAESDPQSEAHHAAKAAAVAAYRQYLTQAPDTADREQIEANIVALGGSLSTTSPDWKPELVHPKDVPAAPALTDPLAGIVLADSDDAVDDPRPDDSENAAQAQAGAIIAPPQPRPNKTNPARVSLGVFLPLVAASPAEMTRSTELSSAPLVGLGLRGGGFLGARRRINLGGELSLAGQPLSSAKRHIITSGWVGLTLRYSHPVGERFELGGGGLVAATGQSLRYTGSDPLRCGVSQSGPISQRTGVLLAARLVAAVLLGRKRRHALSLRVTPGFAGQGPGTANQDEGDASMGLGPCRDEPTPFEEFGLERTSAFVLVTDFGYSVRL